MPRPSTLTFAALAIGAAVATGLTGCTATERDGPDRTASASATATDAPAETVYDKCVDGNATVLASGIAKGATFRLKGDCSTVSVVGRAKKGTTVELGAVELLVIEGDRITATAKSAARIVVPGDRNTVTYGGESDIDDQGEGNTIRAR